MSGWGVCTNRLHPTRAATTAVSFGACGHRVLACDEDAAVVERLTQQPSCPICGGDTRSLLGSGPTVPA